MGNNREGLELDLQKLLMAYLHKWWLIVIATVVAAAISWVVTANFITPMYRASVMIYVNNVASDQQMDTISSGNLSTSQRLVNTYVNIIESDTVLAKVADASGLNITAGQIRSVMSAEQVDDTEIFKVYITHSNPQLAADIANAIAEVAPNEIENIVVGSSTKIIDHAKVPTSPASPSVSRNTVLGGLVGCVIAVIYLTLVFLLDVRIKDEEDLHAIFDFPVLAQIPVFGTDSERKNSYGNNAYAKSGYGYAASAEKGVEA